MGLTEDRERFREVGETRRADLAEFISHGDLGGSGADRIRIPIKLVDLPAFEYDQRSAGGVGQGGDSQPQPGQPVDPEPGDGDEAGDPGEEGGDHEYYEMDPEEFARELDEALGLDLEPKGKQVIEEVEGDFTDTARAGPRGTLDVDEFFKRGLKRHLATDFDGAYVREGLFVDGADVDDVFAWARDEGVPVSRAWIADAAATLADERGEPVAALDRWESFEAFDDGVDHEPVTHRIRREGLDSVPFRSEDERFRHPEVIEKRERNVVVINVRDASGSMRETKRELVERVFTPMDWYLTGKYDAAEFRYVVHDAEAWEVDREEFFGIQSGGGTRISSAYELVEELLEEYPYSEWNRYVFAAGDSENAGSDTTNNVIPLMESIDANLHAYVETQPGDGAANARHADEVESAFGDADDVAVARVSEPDDITDAIYEILSTESDGGGSAPAGTTAARRTDGGERR
ncbi:YeaH/YhbH family protein [Halorubrum ezzemoulense]|uniref:YeaH/YhbH family protein n=1 Tax=Halorubrum ezzemoulense TaxID=337243 RepID=UPI00232B6BBE|nr:YeaH/YhbH family protein [Halorubrum ezzemoulense]MDB9234286.1 YeaH/YhbH family protein [Halorubrum ezzemoulense]